MCQVGHPEGLKLGVVLIVNQFGHGGYVMGWDIHLYAYLGSGGYA